MARVLGLGCLGLTLLAGLAGCTIGPSPANPMQVGAVGTPCPDNPLFAPEGPDGYGVVFDRTYDVLQEYFDIKRANRFDGTIVTWPKSTAGYLDLAVFGAYDSYELWESTFQSIRRYAVVNITPADVGGYYINVAVYKQLEDLPKPTHANTGAASLRHENPIERGAAVVEFTLLPHGWIDIGQDCALERVILARLKNCL